jgi:hypothetical protein
MPGFGLKRYRKKPVVVDAVQLPPVTMAATQPIAYTDKVRAIARWCGGQMTDVKDRQREEGPVLTVPTLAGPQPATAGDWIVKTVLGDFYPCKPDVFEATHEEVQEGEW